ncbi:unnamed protein product [Ambrosiozyma monospora]|uniref:Unnamed protein product n=1 Tax=Ambrosiozyma monospora TaxID=43982 RepID=A0ACB5SRI0_AMBMO|nr:unnamed protein product [Ambrosiozyma monospora]
MAVSNSNPTETGFLYFINGNTKHSSYDTTIICSDNIQAQLLSMTRYDDLLNDVTCMVLKELDLRLYLNELGSSPFMDQFINFVTSKSVRLTSVFVQTNESGEMTQ